MDTRSRRKFHSSARNGNRLLLIGGFGSRSTEWIPLDGSPSQPGPFDVRHGEDHCTAQISEDLVVVSGGDGSFDLVSSFFVLTVPLWGGGDKDVSFRKFILYLECIAL